MKQKLQNIDELLRENDLLKKQLAVEAALEKVRVVAMAMDKAADMLEVCRMIALQMEKLGVKEIRNVQTAIFYESKATYMNYEYYAKHDKTFITETTYSNNKIHNAFAQQMLKGKGESFYTHISKAELKDWLDYQKTTNVFIDIFLETAPSLNYYWFSLGEVALGISTYEILKDDELNLFKRFLSVFELAFRRHLDIEKAEAQAREAAIELGLERVRARAMAMQHSDELAELVTVVFKELTQLDFHITSSIIWINNPESLTNTLWVTSAEMNQPAQPIELTPFQHPFFHSIIHAWKAKDPKWVYLLTGKEKSSFEKLFFESAPGLPKALKSALTVPEKVLFSASFNDFGALELIGTEKLSDDKFEILHRFGKVFNSSYTRFNDLKKAEAQTREAQIELGLERVRARAMAMQTSDELKELIGTVFTELTKLDLVLTRCVIMIYNGEANDSKWWMANSEDPNNPAGFFIKQHDHPPIAAYFKAWRERNLKWTYALEGQIKKDWDVFLFNETELRTLPDFVIEGMKAPDIVYLNASFNNFGNLTLASLEPLSDEHFDILLRFAKVFDLTYTRFNDLQKAEAQTREAQIEVAVERVRAKALAMHKSEDLHSVVVALKKELMGLQIPGVTASTIYLEQEDGSIRILDISDTGEKEDDPSHFKMDKVIRLEDTDPDLWIRRIWNGTENYFVVEVDEADFKRVVAWLYTLDKKEAQIAEKIIKEKCIKKAWLPTVKLEKGRMNIDLLEPPTPEIESILLKMGAGFDLAYKRFLDLQKAEAQAREAKIETALEKVRSRTMAMQRSDELPETSHLLFEQMKELGEPVEQLSIGIVHEENNVIEISATLLGDTLKKIYLHSIDEPYMMTKVYKAWKTQQKTLIVELKGEELNSYNKYRNELTNSNMFPTNLGDEHRRIVYAAFFSKGMLALGANEPRPPQSLQLLERFASVFDLTYTRFLDLQKAEAQAREAQIEASLERVRSASMAMHSSDELENVIKVLTDQLIILGFEFHSANFITNASMPDWEIWISSPGSNIPPKLFVPYFDHRLFNERNDAVTSGKEILTIVLDPEEKSRFLNYFFEYSNAKNTDADRIKWVLDQPGMALTTVVTKLFSLSVINYYGKLYTDSENEVIKRLAYVFEQSYTRFLDLQKAEVQAREAQIEVSLERVRSRAMAMHKTDELLDAAELVYKELSSLGITSMNVSYAFVDEQEKYGTYYSVNPVDGKTVPFPFVFPHTETKVMRSLLSSWKKQEPFNVIELDEKATLKHQTYIGEHIQKLIEKNNPGIPFSIEAFLEVSPKKAVIYNFNFTQGYIFVIGSTHLTNEQEQIVLRFTKVFELTYRRFLDLKQAEAQAREAQIEAALERVRSRSMAMHKSEELADLSLELVKQVQALGVATWFCAFNIYDDDANSSIEWGSNGQGVFAQYRTPREGVFLRYYEAGLRGETLLINEIGEDECPAHYEYLCSLPGVGDQLLQMKAAGIPFPKQQIDHVAFFKHGYIIFITYEPEPETHDIFKRFARVFEQSYTRFLDLQKAEAQAREAQIEIGLERVRSKTMAMHKSEEVTGVAVTLNEELLKLGFEGGSTIIIIDRDSGDTEQWTGFSEDKYLKSCYVPYFKHPCHDALLDSWKNRENFLVYTVKGAEKKSLDEHYFSTGYKNFPESDKKWMREMESVTFSHAFMKYGAIHWGPDHLTEEQLRILQRFSKVFEQSYTRFLDLQNAEALAREAELEKKRSEDLLLNILPREIANELKQFGKSYARKHEQVSILFTDIKGFSTISETLSPEELVNQLDECFRAFDNIVGKYGLEKIKTIGDAYVCACGLPNPDPDNAVKTVRAALAMLDFTKGFALTKTIQDLPAFEFRFGIHTGPIVTGVVGLKKFTYDVWGDAVNMAARMEQHGEANKINISNNTYQLVKDKVNCVHRGKIAAKNKGEVDMYFVEGLR